MERLLYFLPEKQQTVATRYGVSALLMACSLVVFAAMEAQSGFIGLYILLPAIFLAGLMFDRGSGLFATLLAIAGVVWVCVCSCRQRLHSRCSFLPS
jgi:two-component system, sensor histidine kinase PdtaS